MESWRAVWRKGVAPLLSRKSLECLQKALREDDIRLIQGATTSPPPLQCVQDWPVEAACGLGFCGWQAEGLETVAEVDEFFARMSYEIDQRLGEPAGCLWFLNWFDETPRDEMRRQLLQEVTLSLAQPSKAAEAVRPLWNGPLLIVPHPAYRVVTNQLLEMAGDLLEEGWVGTVELKQAKGFVETIRS